MSNDFPNAHNTMKLELTHSTFGVTFRFFTLIPHDFGMQKPPLLDNLDLIKVCETGILWEQFHHGLR